MGLNFWAEAPNFESSFHLFILITILSDMDAAANYLQSTQKLFRFYKSMGDKTLAQLDESHIHEPSGAANNIAIIVKHLSGNMLSRFTDFLSSDGEKSWRKRDDEFVDDIRDKAHLMETWEKGWACLFGAIDGLSPEHMTQLVYIRNEGHTVIEALSRQLTHYAYHIGQLVFLARECVGAQWQTLSIPKGQSQQFNQQKFDKKKGRQFFT